MYKRWFLGFVSWFPMAQKKMAYCNPMGVQSLFLGVCAFPFVSIWVVTNIWLVALPNGCTKRLGKMCVWIHIKDYDARMQIHTRVCMCSAAELGAISRYILDTNIGNLRKGWLAA